MARLFLLRLNTGKKPAPAASRRRVLSPCTGSILITSAPRSASTRPHEGPITMCANSTTRTPASGSTLASREAGLALLDEGREAFVEIRLGGALRERFGFALELRFEARAERGIEEGFRPAVHGGR